MSILSLIIKREFVAKVRNKSFVVMTFLSPLLFVAISLVISYLSSMKSDPKKIGIHDKSTLFANEFSALNTKNGDYIFYNVSALSINQLKKSTLNQEYDGLVFIPNTTSLDSTIQYISNESPSLAFVEKIETLISQKRTKINLEKANISPKAIQAAQAKVVINQVKTSGEQSIKGLNEIKIAVGGAFGYLIMMFIIIYGNMVMRSVIEEKTNRIVEIIISSVKPFQLMLGKIIGTALAGLLQFSIWSFLGLGLLYLASTFLGMEVEIATKLPASGTSLSSFAQNLQPILAGLQSLPIAKILICFVLYFIGGFFLYSSFYAAIGAAVDSETDTQQFLLPIILPLIFAVYIGFFSVANDPHGTVATTFSIVPLTAPIVMLMRIPFGVPLWQIALSVALLVLSFLILVWFSAKIYRVGILMYGKKPTWKELYKWMRL